VSLVIRFNPWHKAPKELGKPPLRVRLSVMLRSGMEGMGCGHISTEGLSGLTSGNFERFRSVAEFIMVIE
jgi:hypothetical protein